MKVMMLIADDCRKQVANDEVCWLADKIHGLESNGHDAVVSAFQKFANPDIQQGVGRCVELGGDFNDEGYTS